MPRTAEEEKKHRLKNYDKTTPSRATSKVWSEGYFKVYSRNRLPVIAVCMLCLKQERYSSAECNYGKNKLSGNLLQHLDSTKPGHMDAWRPYGRLLFVYKR